MRFVVIFEKISNIQNSFRVGSPQTSKFLICVKKAAVPIEAMDKAVKDFQRLMTEHRRLLDGHRVMMKNFPKWKDEFENRMGLDMYTATKDSKLLPKSFVNDEHAWINALQTRLESLHFNMKYLHEQRQLLEKTHKDLEKLFAIFNRNRKFMHLIDLPAFDPQQCEKILKFYSV